MRLSRVSFAGYARFDEASCNVDGHVIALIGPNEAGKSTALRGLEWLTSGGSLAAPLLNRERARAEHEVAVEATFILDETELGLIRALDVDASSRLEDLQPTKMTVGRVRDGGIRWQFVPELGRNPAPFEDVLSDLQKVRDADAAKAAGGDLDVIEANVDPSDELWPEARVAALRSATTSLKAILSDDAGRIANGEGDPDLVSLHELIKSLEVAIEAAQKPNPDKVAWEAVSPFIPEFVLFKEQDRELPGRFQVGVGAAIPNALRNLLQIGGTSVEAIELAIGEGQTRYRSLERTVNKKLSAISDFWSQSTLTPHVGIAESGVIDISIDDTEGVIDVTERSEGLQAFLALVCFLLTSRRDVPPILLIDEAERNLHYDAQGDLVRLLTNDLPVAQVIYSTHSPGCLPLDMGNGIRVVARDPDNDRRSIFRDNFWTDEEPGFSRLLFAMGAKAAAFSALNKALLAEGPTEMILLPALLRRADPDRVIDFQVAFGLSNMSIPDDIGTVSLLTTYIVDGDESGASKLDALREVGVPEANLMQLPIGFATEDLLDRDFYLDNVDAVIRDSGGSKLVDRAQLDPTRTIAKAVDMLPKKVKGFKPPGHKIVAARIARAPGDVRLSDAGLQYLRDELWPKLYIAFADSYQLTSPLAK